MKRFWLTVGLLAWVAAPAQAQQIRGRVVDDATRQPLADVAVALLAPSGDVVTTALSGDDGFFTLRAPAAGRYRVRAQRLGYRAAEQEVNVAAANLTMPALVLVSDAIPLDSVEVTARSRREAPQPGTGGRTFNVVAGSRLATLERMSGSTHTAIRELVGIRMRTLTTFTDEAGQRHRNYVCIESSRRVGSMGPRAACDPVVLVLDGIPVGDPHLNLRGMTLADVESIEFLSPMDAGHRFGLDASARGALVVWTRGRGPHRSADRDRS